MTKFNKVIAVALVGLASAGWGSHTSAFAGALAESDRCAVAQSAFALLPGEQSAETYWSRVAPKLPPPAGGFAGPQPSPALLAAYTNAVAESAFQCAAVASDASTKGELKTATDEQGLLAKGTNIKPVTIRQVSLPIVDKTGREAIFAVKVVSSGLGASGALYYLRRTDAGWSVASIKPLFSS